MDTARTLDARLRGRDDQEVIPAKAGIQKPYVQLQTAIEAALRLTAACLSMRKGRPPSTSFYAAKGNAYTAT